MADTQTDVLVAGYRDIDMATRDFDGLMQVVAGKQVEIEGAILVTHDADGAITVVQHGDHLGRKGLGWGAGAGLVVGLFAPPLLASVAVGGAVGGLIGKFTDRKVKSGMEGLGRRAAARHRGQSSRSSTTSTGSRSSRPCRDRRRSRSLRRTRTASAP